MSCVCQISILNLAIRPIAISLVAVILRAPPPLAPLAPFLIPLIPFLQINWVIGQLMLVAVTDLVINYSAESWVNESASGEWKGSNHSRIRSITWIAVVVANNLMEPGSTFSHNKVRIVENTSVDPMDMPTDKSRSVKYNKDLRSRGIASVKRNNLTWVFSINTHMKSRQPSTYSVASPGTLKPPVKEKPNRSFGYIAAAKTLSTVQFKARSSNSKAACAACDVSL